jgi:hypothetical protein
MCRRRREDFYLKLVLATILPIIKIHSLTENREFQLDFTLLTFGTLGMLIKWVNNPLTFCESRLAKCCTD